MTAGRGRGRAGARRTIGLGAVTVIAGRACGASCEEATSANPKIVMSAELLRSSMRRKWTDIGIPRSYVQDRHKLLERSIAEGHNRRCQARGGPRAWNESGGAAAKSLSAAIASDAPVNTPGASSSHAAVGVNVPASWISAQMAQKSPAWLIGSGLAGGLLGSDVGAEAANAAFCTVAVPPSTCTCPNDNVSWTASANNAPQAPHRTFERIQRIVATHAPQRFKPSNRWPPRL